MLECRSISNLISHKEFLCVQLNLSYVLNRNLPHWCLPHCIACRLLIAMLKLHYHFFSFLSRLINQRLMEEQSQVEELQKTVDEQGSKADDVSK